MSTIRLEGALEVAVDTVRTQLRTRAESLRTEGIAIPRIDGKLLRPTTAWALVPPAGRPGLPDAFWYGALAIQMVHEASLIHDDILDTAAERRGEPTTVAREGLNRALVRGDLYLTSAYRVAARAGDTGFLTGFIEAVERTVTGEVRQNSARGEFLGRDEYEAVIRAKSGELFGASARLAARFGAPDVTVDLGCRIGSLYQRVDDLLDYCASVPQGKPALQDWRQRKWTFVLELAKVDRWDVSESELMARLRDPVHGPPLTAALDHLEEEARALTEEAPGAAGDVELLAEMLDGWCRAARSAVETELGREGVRSRAGEGDAVSVQSTNRGPARSAAPDSRGSAAPSMEAVVASAACRLGPEVRWGRYFGHHSRSFRFASWLFPAEARRDVSGVYAYCRFTDDLVDETEVPVERARAQLAVWRELSSAAYRGHPTGIPLLDTVLPRMARAGAPFHYVDDLLAGIETDLEPVPFRTQEDLEVYTYRVASVVGGWITEQFGLHDPELLARAFSMGHAMQLTNVLRDVGEDLRRGRLYLPTDTLGRHGLEADDLEGLAAGSRPLPEGWIDLLESLMAAADDHYDRGFEALPDLPGWYARPVAVACRVYQGIHDEIRRNGYDTLSRRAWTSGWTKLRLGARGLLDLRRVRRAEAGPPATPVLAPSDG